MSKNNYYPLVKLPNKKDNIVFPFRREKSIKPSFIDNIFINELNKHPINGLRILTDTLIVPEDYAKPYHPNIALINENVFYIDIEIDRPYDSKLTPKHYINGGDNFRDMVMNNLGWIVIRFTEKQILSETSACINLLKKAISLYQPCFDIFLYREDMLMPTPQKRWTEIEAKILASQNNKTIFSNHKYLFSKLHHNDLEKKIYNQIDRLHLPDEYEANNLDGSNLSFEQDKLINFEANEHIYVYDGKIRLTSVSRVISSYFEPFDYMRISNFKAMKEGISQAQLLEEWDLKGAIARDTGTFMHAQIENYLNNKESLESFDFSYDGQFHQFKDSISIKKEMSLFHNFLNDYKLIPFRTEWRISDLENKIAGSVDLICRNGDKFDIYDWKRSEKLINSFTGRPYLHGYNNKCGINGLEDIQDTSYWHYCLQQNIYKYILEKNYGIKIASMHLIVLHPNYSNYIPLKVDDMTDIIKRMLK